MLPGVACAGTSAVRSADEGSSHVADAPRLQESRNEAALPGSSEQRCQQLLAVAFAALPSAPAGAACSAAALDPACRRQQQYLRQLRCAPAACWEKRVLGGRVACAANPSRYTRLRCVLQAADVHIRMLGATAEVPAACICRGLRLRGLPAACLPACRRQQQSAGHGATPPQEDASGEKHAPTARRRAEGDHRRAAGVPHGGRGDLATAGSQTGAAPGAMSSCGAQQPAAVPAALPIPCASLVGAAAPAVCRPLAS